MKRRITATSLLLGAVLSCGSPSEPARVESGGFAIEARVEPPAPRMGANRMLLALLDTEGQPVEGAEVGVKVHMHAMGAMPAMGGSARVRERRGGRYEADFALDMGGTWRIEIEARTADRRRGRAEGSLTVGTPGLLLEAVAGTAPRDAEREPDPGATHPAEFAIPAARVQQIGVRTERAEVRTLAREIRALGVVVADETALVDVSLKVSGWVRSLRADALGVRVERGQVLFTLYSPEIYAAQEEYLQALASQERARRSTAPERADWRVGAARRRLELWDVAPGDLEVLAQRGAPQQEIPIRSPATGFVFEKDLAVGAAIEPGKRLLRIVPLERIWIEAEVYESEAPLLAAGLSARVDLPYLPGRSFEGRLATVLPMLDAATRTLRARIVVDNPELALRPGMWANVVLRAPGAPRLTVPESAVLRAGARNFVFLELGAGRFRPQAVELGMRSGEWIEVLAGLAPGQRVVASGTFLIASESRLRAALDQW
jgi:Cu(I)/Ag(I) efflux system membrane fusion protein